VAPEKKFQLRDYPAIGRKLGARHLLEASVCRVNGQTRVTLTLVDLGDSVHIWAETYERPSQDVFALASEIAQAVAAQLQTRLSARRDSGARYYVDY
jgi:TolB-like protein